MGIENLIKIIDSNDEAIYIDPKKIIALEPHDRSHTFVHLQDAPDSIQIMGITTQQMYKYLMNKK